MTGYLALKIIVGAEVLALAGFALALCIISARPLPRDPEA